MIWAEEVVYKQEYPFPEKRLGWVYAEKVYSIPVKGATVGSDGFVPDKQMRQSLFLCIATNHDLKFRCNIQREKKDVLYTGNVMPFDEFEKKFDKVSMLMREWV